MNRRTFLVGALPSGIGLSAASQTKRYLYMSTPDASQENYKSGHGILVFDIDDGHKFVRRIDVPDFSEALCANMTETSCVTAISEQGGKEIQHGNNERYCSPGV